MNDGCKICGTKLEDDFFAFVTQRPVCAICEQRFIGGLPVAERVKEVREQLGLAEGEYLKQDRAEEARRILGR